MRFDKQKADMRIETLSAAVIHWSDDWKTVMDVTAWDSVPGILMADLPAQDLIEGSQVRFTLYRPDAHRWQGADFVVPVCSFKRESGADAGQD